MGQPLAKRCGDSHPTSLVCPLSLHTPEKGRSWDSALERAPAEADLYFRLALPVTGRETDLIVDKSLNFSQPLSPPGDCYICFPHGNILRSKCDYMWVSTVPAGSDSTLLC